MVKRSSHRRKTLQGKRIDAAGRIDRSSGHRVYCTSSFIRTIPSALEFTPDLLTLPNEVGQALAGLTVAGLTAGGESHPAPKTYCCAGPHDRRQYFSTTERSRQGTAEFVIRQSCLGKAVFPKLFLMAETRFQCKVRLLNLTVENT